MSKRYQQFINNEWVDAQSGEWFDSLDPFSGKAWAQVPLANEQDVDRAVMGHQELCSSGELYVQLLSVYQGSQVVDGP